MRYLKVIQLFCLLSICQITYSQDAPIKPKKREYYEYQNNNAYKGIKFGSSYADVKDKLKLEKEYFPEAFTITNLDYLRFNDIIFKTGQAYFTPISKKLYQVVLYKDDICPNCASYNSLKNNIISLFGANDAEYYDLDEYKRMIMSMGWYGEVRVSINLQTESKLKNAQVSITVYNGTYNALSQSEMLKKTQPVVPKI